MPVTAHVSLVVLELCRPDSSVHDDHAGEAAYELAAARLVEYARELGLHVHARRVERAAAPLEDARRKRRRLIRFAIG